ncbi:TPA: DNA-directed RNA polymerase subunit delta [Candidatus Avacholeplasma faecigallinarum]|nr:DNA-directed RNA polymerase subunit delta [Candidatus Avacholeplasma faecigallinarum]
MENISQMSLLEVAVKLMEQKRGVQNIRNLIKEVLEMKGLNDEDGEYATQLYIDITTSSKFVYMGNDEWDLKIRQSLDEFDKDGSAFNSKDDEVEEDEVVEDNLDEEDLETSDEQDEEDEDYEDDNEYEDEEDEDYDEDNDSYDDSDDELNDGEDIDRYTEEGFNEDKYNDYMDDYEDMYDEN